MDPTQQSTGLPTGDPNAANLATQQQQNPASVLPVNPAQTLPSQQQQSSLDPHLVANYEQRIRDLMSQKDRAINERDKAITDLANLQRQYTDDQQQTHQSLNNTAQAAQSAIDHARSQDIRIKQLEGELLRASTLLERPHLAPYSQFIQPIGDAEQMKALVDQLETIRNQDIERSRSGSVSQVSGLQQQQYPPQQTLPSQPQLTNPLSLYANRPNMAPSLVPASSPAMMHPSGGANPIDTIQQMLNEASASGDPGKFQSVLEQAKVLANSAVNQQLGR